MAASNAPLPDQAEREAILRELDRNLLVEAAAGTGKTTSMVGRMTALLAEGRCRVSTLAAVTFTRKAAAELRGRFRLALEQAAPKASGAARGRLHDALAGCDQCFIGTIHSFCARLLRERPVEAGVALAFREIEQEEDARLREEAWKVFCDRLFVADPEGILPALRSVNLRLADLKDPFLSFTDYPDVAEWPGGATLSEIEDTRETLQKTLQYAAHMKALAAALPRSSGSDTLIPLYRRIPRIIAHFRDPSDPVQLMEILDFFDSEGKITLKEWKKAGLSGDEAKAEKQRWDDFRAGVVKPQLALWRAVRYGPALRALAAARRVYDALRGERGLLDFQDLLMRAAELLRDKPHVRAYFARRFSHLLVDEFQDTDPIQAEVLLLLTATDPAETDWRRCRPRPGSLFVVGDPKQSIYRFRRADIVTYNHVRDLITRSGDAASAGRQVALRTNFRSGPDLVAWVNRVFAPEFPETPTEESPAYVPLLPARSDPPRADLCGVRVLRIPGAHARTKAAAVAYEADFIARTIRHALDKGLTVPRSERERAEGASPAASPRDFLIVTYRTDVLSAYARALQEYGIPHQATGGAALNECDELRLLHLALKAAVYPEDPVALVAALRSELFGISDSALFAFKQAGGEFDYTRKVPEGFAGDAAVREAFERLRRCARWVERLPFAAGVERAADELGLLACAAARPGGDVQAGSLGKAVELLRAARDTAWSAAHGVELLERLVAQEEKYDGVSALSEDPPAVRVMNLHKVKGLEAPVVFLAGAAGMWHPPAAVHLDRSSARVRGHMSFTRKHGEFQYETLAHPKDWEALAEREDRFRDAELLRLHYVAATRAGAMLVVALRDCRASDNPWEFFRATLDGAPDLPDPGPQSAPGAAEAVVNAQEIASAQEAIRHRFESALRPSYQVHAAKAYALAEPPADEEALSFAEPGAAPPSLAAEGEHGLEWGTVIHQLLEAVMNDPKADLPALAEAALGEVHLDAALVATAVATVRAVTGSEVWARALRSPSRLTEVPFEVRADGLGRGGNGAPAILRGAMDLVFREDDGWVIVDYKSDRLPAGGAAALTAKYAPQLRLYAEAWTHATGEPVREMGLFLVQTGAYARIAADGGAARCAL